VEGQLAGADRAPRSRLAGINLYDGIVETPQSQPSALNPRAEYSARLRARRSEVEHHARRHWWIANARLAVFALLLVAGWFVFGPSRLFFGWLVPPLALFIYLLILHDRISRAQRRAERTVLFYERGLARLEHRWHGAGQPGLRFQSEQHPYALDLDIFGKGSLFELLCGARTRQGEDMLAAWLMQPAAADEVHARQEAVRELSNRLNLREALSLLGSEVLGGFELGMLGPWAAAPPFLTAKYASILCWALPAFAIGSLAWWLLLDHSALLFGIALLLEAAFAFRLREAVEKVVGPVERRTQELVVFGGVLAFLERETFQSARLRALRAALDTHGMPPSQRIAQLQRLVDWLAARRNAIFVPFAPILLWTTQHAFAIEAWRRAAGAGVNRWLEVLGEFEALSDLAGYAYENPTDPFPQIASGAPIFEGEALGHPFIPASSCICNDVHFGAPLRLLMVSGSNMSGKSTLLRTVGVNAVLALAGAPVRATRLRLSPFFVGATLRIQDSLQAGRSRFYAEIMRVRQLLEMAREQPPLLFLLDELFQGTNSHDRKLGAEAVLATLLDLGAFGLVTTHDLALTQIAEKLGDQATNVHFEDQLVDGKMSFDYRMHPGVVQHSNALALMRAVGIDV
jgi:hypothetical protein